MARDISAEIDRLSRQRAALWARGDGEGADECSRITSKLADLYEEKRLKVAAAGSPSQRKRIIDRARVEREFDRLMAQE